MHIAVHNNHLKMVQWLFDNGAAEDVRQPDNNGCTPMHIAVQNNHLKMVHWLCNHGATGDILKSDKDGDTPKSMAVRKKSTGASFEYFIHASPQLQVLRVLLRKEHDCPPTQKMFAVRCRCLLQPALPRSANDAASFCMHPMARSCNVHGVERRRTESESSTRRRCWIKRTGIDMVWRAVIGKRNHPVYA